MRRYLSSGFPGKTHDFQVLKELFPPHQRHFEKLKILVDLGFLGIERQYSLDSVQIPYKKSKNKPLTAQQKEGNRTISAKRMKVERSFAGLRRYRVLSDRLRIHRTDFYDQILGVCAGLWNFQIDN